MSQDQLASPEPSSSESSGTPPKEALETLPDEATETDAVESVPMSTETEPSYPVTVNARAIPARRPSPVNDEILPQTLLRLLGEAVVAAQPPLKKQSVKALQGTIHLLEKAVERLEAEPTPKKSTSRLPASGTASENVSPSSRTRPGRLPPTLSADVLQAKVQTIWQQLWRSWRPVLRQIRDRLPTSINRNISDRALTGAIAGIFIILLSTASSLLPVKPQPTTIAKVSPAETVVPSPKPAPEPTLTPTPPAGTPEASKPVAISPTPPKPSVPPPPLKLTPEQKLIARIQDQVAAISNPYASGLIQSVQANFRGSRLIVNVSDGWYGLSQSQQDNLASEILRRTETLDFIKLEMVDAAGRLLARSPVVGSEMIILKRSTASAEAA